MKALPTLALVTGSCALLGVVIFSGAGHSPKVQPSTNQRPNVQTADYEIAPGDCDRTIHIRGGQWTLTLPDTSDFAEGCRITVRNGDTWSGGRGKKLRGTFPADFTNGQQILWPLQSGSVEVVGRQWATIGRPGRPKLPHGEINFYSDYTVKGGDKDNDCMAPGEGNACQTAAHAIQLPCNEFEFSGTDMMQTRFTVNMAKGVADRSWIHYACPAIPGANGGAHLVLNGQGSAELAAIGKDAIGVVVNATLAITGLTISSAKGDCVHAEYGGQVFFAGGNTIRSCAGADFSAKGSGSDIHIMADYVDEGHWAKHFDTANGGVVIERKPPSE